jgi:hypothetical protein
MDAYQVQEINKYKLKKFIEDLDPSKVKLVALTRGDDPAYYTVVTLVVAS